MISRLSYARNKARMIIACGENHPDCLRSACGHPTNYPSGFRPASIPARRGSTNGGRGGFFSLAVGGRRKPAALPAPRALACGRLVLLLEHMQLGGGAALAHCEHDDPRVGM